MSDFLYIVVTRILTKSRLRAEHRAYIALSDLIYRYLVGGRNPACVQQHYCLTFWSITAPICPHQLIEPVFTLLQLNLAITDNKQAEVMISGKAHLAILSGQSSISHPAKVQVTAWRIAVSPRRCFHTRQSHFILLIVKPLRITSFQPP